MTIKLPKCWWNNDLFVLFLLAIPRKVLSRNHGKICLGYLQQGNYNIWMVNWAELAAGPFYCYPAAVHNVQYVGRCLATAIERLMIAASSSLRLHVIGFSLGAHIPSAAALLLKPYLIPRITCRYKLCFVLEIIHTKISYFRC